MDRRVGSPAFTLAPELSAHLVPARRLEEKRGVLPTGMPILDGLLGGGWPRGCLSELSGRRSSGRTSVLCASLAGAIAQGETVALIDSGGGLDPRAAERAGVQLSRLLWVRCTSRQALPAADLVIAAGGFGLCAVDLGEADPAQAYALARISLAAWVRLARAAERQGTAVIVALPFRALGTFAATSLALERRGPLFAGRGIEPRLLAALDVEGWIARTRTRGAAHRTSRILLQA